MSRHWWQCQVVRTKALSASDIAKLIAIIAGNDQQLAKQLAAVNWQDVIVACATQALQKVAAENDVKYSADIDLRGQQEGKVSTDGKLAGALIGGNVQISVRVNKDLSIDINTARWLYDMSRSITYEEEVAQLQKAFEQNLQQAVYVNALAMLGLQVQVQTDAQGNTILVGVN